MGFFAGLNDEKYDRQYTDRELLRRILSFFGPQKARLLWVLALIVALAGIGAALPIVVARMVDLLKGQATLEAITLVSLAVLGIGIGLWGLNWARRSLVVRAVGDVVLELRTRAFRAAAEHDLSFYDQFSSGRIVSRITSDTNDFGQLVVIVTDVASQFVQAFILGIVLFRTDLKLSLMLMVFLPVIFGIAMLFRNLARKVTKRGMKAMADAALSFTQEQIKDLEIHGFLDLSLGQRQFRLELQDVDVQTSDMPGWLVVSDHGITVALDIVISDVLKQEGIAREFVNRVQNLRKESGLEVTDRISVIFNGDEELQKSIEAYMAYICGEILAVSVSPSALPEGTEVEVYDKQVFVQLNKAS